MTKENKIDDELKEVRYLQPSTLRIEERDSGKLRIVGYAAVFNKLSEDMGFQEKIAPGAFKKVLKDSDTRALINHDPNLVLGRENAETLMLQEKKEGLWMEIDPPDTSYARDLMVSIKRQDIDGQSFAFRVGADKWEGLDDEKKIPIRTILEVSHLYDVGPVTYPAYPDTNVALRSMEAAKKSIFTLPEFKDLLPNVINELIGIEDINSEEYRKKTVKVIKLVLGRFDPKFENKSFDEFIEQFTVALRKSLGIEPMQDTSDDNDTAELTQGGDTDVEPTQDVSTEDRGRYNWDELDITLARLQE